MPNMPETIQKMLRGEIPPPPIAQLVGLNLVSIQTGEAVFELQASQRHANPMGTLHGGVLCDIADAAMGMAFASILQDNESFTTIELKINFLRPVWNEKLRALARVVKTGKVIGLVECDVVGEENQLVAHATSTCMVLRGTETNVR